MNREQLVECLGKAPAGAGLLFPGKQNVDFWRGLRSSALMKPYIDEIHAEGDRLLQEPIGEPTYSLFALFEQKGSRLEFERVYFEKRRRLNTMALLSLLEPEPANLRFREALNDILWSICNEYTWCLPAHLKNSAETDGQLSFSVDTPEWSRQERKTSIDLFAAETGFALAEIMRLTEVWLPALLRSRIAEEVVKRLIKPYLHHGPYHWETAEHNWAAVCAGSIASAALLLIDSPEQLAPVAEKALASMECYLNGFGEDGACLEGVGYWNYGFGYFVYFADLLKKRTMGRIDLFSWDKVRQIACFQQKIYLDGDMVANFSDSLQRASVQIGLTHYLAGLYPEVDVPPLKLRSPYTEDHCSRWAPALRNLLWFDPKKGDGNWQTADSMLKNAQWFVSRHNAKGLRYGFAAKGGHNNEPHNHNDVGQFILTGGGQIFLCDLGSGEYTDQYFGPERYTYDCNGSQGHSVPIVDGQFQSPGAESAAEELQLTLGEREARLRFEMKGAYRLPNLQLLLRQFVWSKSEPPILILQDSFRFATPPSAIVERFVTQIKPFPEEGKVKLQGDGGCTLVIRFNPEVVKANVTNQSYRDHFGRDTKWYAMDFQVKRPQDKLKHVIEFAFQFIE